MAKPDTKANHSKTGRAEGQSALADGEAAGGQEEVKRENSGGETRKDAADKSLSDSDWGFSSGRTGMAKETKLGLAVCVFLLGAFGFVVYSKMTKPSQLDESVLARSDMPLSSIINSSPSTDVDLRPSGITHHSVQDRFPFLLYVTGRFSRSYQ